MVRRRYALKMAIIPVNAAATTVVIFLLTNLPIKVLFFVKIMRGIIGRGIKILSTT